MTAEHIASQLTEGTILEGPHWTELVKILTAKRRGGRIEVEPQGRGERRAVHGRAERLDTGGPPKR